MGRLVKVRTIDIQAKEWFDNSGGNSYFSAEVTVNFGEKSEQGFSLPFQYGYDRHYIYEAMVMLIAEGVITGCNGAFWRYCKDQGIELRTNIQTNCKRSEL